MNSAYSQLVSYVSEIKELNQSSASALIVIQNNKIVLEHYEGHHSNIESEPIDVNSMFNVASARKSYLGLAIAYALHEKKIESLDDVITKYLTKYNGDIFEGTTIRHLVTHSHGLNEADDGSIFREFPPGSEWAYRGINVKIITELFKDLYGYDFTKLIKERVFTPLGFGRTAWSTSPSPYLVKVVDDPSREASYKLYPTDDGFGSNLHTTAREFASWGNLHLNNGYHNGVQVVPEEVIRISTSLQSPEYHEKELPAHGLFWYVQDRPRSKSEIGNLVPDGSYQILGNTGPMLLVIPEYQVVIVRMYNKRLNYGGDNYLDYLQEFGNLASKAFSTNSAIS